jgi:hypothetical protein
MMVALFTYIHFQSSTNRPTLHFKPHATLLLLGRGSLISDALDETSSDLLAHLVEAAHEAVFAGRVGLAVPFLIVPTMSALETCQLDGRDA